MFRVVGVVMASLNIIKYIQKVFIFCCIVVTSTTSACDNEKSLDILKDYIWLTEDYPPYNFYDDDGHLVGMSVEILELVYQELNLPLNRDDIRLIPWARLVKNLKMSNKYAAFTMVSTPTRDRDYTLVPTFLPTTISIMVLEERYHELIDWYVDDLFVAVVREDIGQLVLNQEKIKAKQSVTVSHQNMVNMLYRNRVDAIAFNEELVRYYYNKPDTTQQKIKTLHVLKNNLANSFVFHKESSICATELFTQTLTKLNNRGDIKKIEQRYLPSSR